MRDEDFEVFIDEFGEATHRVVVPQSSIEKWRGKLPNQLLTYWQQEGWCAYVDGIIWTVNPDDYEDIVDEWLEDTQLEQIDSFHVIARSAFGKLYLCGARCGRNLTINPHISAITGLAKELKQKTSEDLDLSIKSFFGSVSISDFDVKDESRKGLFQRAVKKLGLLEPDEMYAFQPALMLGGNMRLENLERVKLDQQLTILRQLGQPSLSISTAEIDKLIKI